MALRSTRRLTLDQIKADRETLLALKNIGDYAPANPAYGTKALAALGEALEQAEQARLRAENELDAAREQALAAAMALHDALLGAKLQVLAQYGHDSFEIQALGLKRKSERKRPSRRTVPQS
jgi:hypothetical protein